MSEQEQSTSTAPETSTTTTESPLEQVYKEYKVDNVANEFQPQRQVQQQTQQTQQQNQSTSVSVPDPILDPKGFATWQSQQAEASRTAASRAEQVAHALIVERQREREERDITSAANAFVEAAATDGIDKDTAEVQLGVLARKDPRFQSLWQNRDKNPQAWNAAVKAAGKQFASKFQFKTDPQIAENVRAAKQSTNSPTTKEQPQGNPLDQRLNEATKAGKFDLEWNRIINSQTY
jgi:hypothetical protein